MGDLIEFPRAAPEMMPGHAVDMRRVIQELRRLALNTGAYPSLMWSLFDLKMSTLISGYTGYTQEARDNGVQLTILTNTVVGECQFSVFVFQQVLDKP